jgi:MFS transporter, DHA2 family, multidrug resistance protein
VTVALIVPIAGRLADRHPAGILGGIGLSILSLGLVLLALLPAQPSDANIVWRIVVCAFGFGFFSPPTIGPSSAARRASAAAALARSKRPPGCSVKRWGLPWWRWYLTMPDRLRARAPPLRFWWQLAFRR